ncbi:MAG: glycerophosphodiester phosphodiesterase family protein, partial [Steroidobacteraceae bacterium]
MTAVTALAEPLVIAHRGASGHRPEHTLESYRLAIEMGADFIEPDLVATRDGHLVARHEPEIGATTDVAKRPEFASRRRTALIDGVEVTGWFTTDFTLAELKTLRAVQPHPDRSSEFDGLYEVPTLEEIIALARDAAVTRGRPVGIYPETKHPSWHCAQGLPLEPALLTALEAAGWTSRESPVFIQSFEAGNLRWLRERTQIRLVQLIGGGAIGPEGIPGPLPTLRMASDCPLYPIETPADLSQSGERRVKAFEEIAAYAD